MPIADILSGGRRGRVWRRWGFGAVSVAVHAALLAALVAATDEEGGPPAVAEEEQVTYVDISAFPPPPPPPAAATPQPEPTPAQPRPTQPRPQAPRPETPPRATDIVEPEPDTVPDEPLGTVPPPEPIQAPVTGGPPAGEVTAGQAGQAGGQAGGVEGGVAGGRPGGQVGAEPAEGGTFVAAVVDRKAELSNRRDLARIMERLYPPRLRDRGIGGRVVVQFVVGENGRVDMSTVQVMSAEHEELVEATRRALGEFRFTPARMGDRSVRMLTQMPIVWQVEGL